MSGLQLNKNTFIYFLTQEVKFKIYSGYLTFKTVLKRRGEKVKSREARGKGALDYTFVLIN